MQAKSLHQIVETVLKNLSTGQTGLHVSTGITICLLRVQLGSNDSALVDAAYSL